MRVIVCVVRAWGEVAQALVEEQMERGAPIHGDESEVLGALFFSFSSL